VRRWERTQYSCKSHRVGLSFGSIPSFSFSSRSSISQDRAGPAHPAAGGTDSSAGLVARGPGAWALLQGPCVKAGSGWAFRGSQGIWVPLAVVCPQG
jgi:hypothetical protein